ncbi:MAG: RluA family pseudouridine synthase [Bryobacter sp.]|jgi:23S rRNA pseudouridine1911/1915/1917 synthase|nr:RluA family pseudouridine synthase [Bryobacter sp. CoA8 C33]
MRNQGYAYTSRISRLEEGRLLLHHLATLYRHTSPEHWQLRLDNGELTLNGVTATGTELLTTGATLVWRRPPWTEPATPQHFELLWEDPHLLAVNKPGGLPTLPGGGFLENTLLHLVQKQIPGANPVHRLGRATTGIVLFTKTQSAAAALSARWNKPDVEKIYRAWAQGAALRDAYEIRTPIGRVPHPKTGFVWAAHPAGKPAYSSATVLARGQSATTFAVRLHSGRPHQIRIHLASIGHPLAGDPLYGPGGQPFDHLPGLPGDGGYLLHAQYLNFPHPVTGEAVHLEAPLPAHFPSHHAQEARKIE